LAQFWSLSGTGRKLIFHPLPPYCRKWIRLVPLSSAGRQPSLWRL